MSFSLRRIKRTIRIWSLLQKIKGHDGVCRFGYQQSGAFFHSPFAFADFDETKMIIALIRLGKLKKTKYIHSTPCNPEHTEFLETPIYNL